RWEICAAGQAWDGALEVAEKLVVSAPGRLSGWIYQAYAWRRVKGGGLQAAWKALRPVAERFPKAEIVPYNLACYAAQLGRLNEAWEWLQRARTISGEVKSLTARALADEALRPLWDRIRAW